MGEEGASAGYLTQGLPTVSLSSVLTSGATGGVFSGNRQGRSFAM